MLKKGILLLILIAAIVALYAMRGEEKKAPDTQPDIQTQGGGEKMEAGSVAVPTIALSGVVEPISSEGGVTISVATEEGGGEVYTFTDVNVDAWYIDSVNYVAAEGVMNGQDLDKENCFLPDYGVSRAQFARILYRFADGEPAQARHNYDDVSKGDWYYDYVCWADSKGYITGVDGESFGVEEFLTCEQALIILHRLAGKPASTASLEDYSYSQKVTSYGIDAVRWAWEKRLITEDGDCIWYPSQAISRAQIATLLMRFAAITQKD